MSHPRSHFLFVIALIGALLLVGGCTDSEPGASSLKELEKGLIAALHAGDLQKAQRFFLDGEELIGKCPERFRSRSKASFLQRLANGRRRFANFFRQCRTKLDGEVTVTRRSGGRKRRQMAGCGEDVWEYGDLVIEGRSGGRHVTITVDGILGVSGRYYIVERVRCQ